MKRFEGEVRLTIILFLALNCHARGQRYDSKNIFAITLAKNGQNFRRKWEKIAENNANSINFRSKNCLKQAISQ
jgi:hypothetical protein